MKLYWAPLLFFIFAYLAPLGFRPMVTPDEFRYAEIPREMLESGNWTSPTLLHMRYFEKPVLGYQLTAASFTLFGENAFALRLPAALAAGLTALLIALFLRRFTGEDKIAAMGALLYLAGGMVYGIGTFAVLDSQTTCFIAGTLICFLPACLEPKFNRVKIVLLLLSGVFAGLAFLTKGFIAFAVPAITVVPFLIWEKRWKDFLILPWLPLLAAVAVILPWALAIHREQPDFWRYFIEVEHIQRFLDKDAPGQHPEPWWFLLPPLILGGLPAALLAPCAVKGLWKDREQLLRAPFVRYSLCYLVFPFLFFSASSGKLATYILPCFTPLAILGAVGLARYFRLGGEYRLFRYPLAVLGLLLALAGVLAAAGRPALPRIAPQWQEASWMPHTPVLVAAIVIVLGWGIALWILRKHSWRRQLAAFFIGMVPLIFVGNLIIRPSAMEDKSPAAALLELRSRIPDDALLICHRSMVHAAAWTLKRPDLLLAVSMGEFDYGLSYPEAADRFLDFSEYQALLLAPERPAVVYLARKGASAYLPENAPAPETFHAGGVDLYYFAPRGKHSQPAQGVL